MAKRLLNRVVEIVFDDHAEDSDKPILCRCFGRVIQDTEKHITVCCWDLDDDDPATLKLNRKTFAIIKSTIRKTTILA